MTVTNTNVGNAALVHLGGYPEITDLDTDTGKAARTIREVFVQQRDATLRDHPWNFATERALVDGNVLTNPTALDVSAWTKTRSSVVANVATAPDGTQSADKIVEDATAANTHVVSQAYTTTAGRTYRGRARFKYVDRTYAHISFLTGGGFGSGAFAIFNLTTGELATSSGTFVDTPTITAVGNGFYECEMKVVATSAAASTITFGPSGAASTSYSGDGASSVYAWKLQLIEEIPPAHGWGYRYPLPSDFIRLLRVGEPHDNYQYRVEGRYLVTNEAALPIVYIKRESTIDNWDEMARDALALRLAHRTCAALTGDTQLKASLWTDYRAALPSARTVDAQEQSADEIEADTWLSSRW